MTDGAFVVVTLLVFGNHAAALRVLRSIRTQTFPVGAIVIVDNHSPIPFMEYLIAHGTQLNENETLKRTERNIGVGAGHNIAIDIAASKQADLVWVLENDTFIDHDCLAELISIRRETADTGKLVILPAVARNEYERPLSDAILAGRETLDKDSDVRAFIFNGPLFTLNLLHQAGPIREDFFVGLEDRDYFYRLMNLGVSIIISGRVLCIHPSCKNIHFREPRSPDREYWAIRNEMLLTRESGYYPPLKRLLRVIAGAGYYFFTGNSEVAYQRLRGLFYGLLKPMINKQFKRTMRGGLVQNHSSSRAAAIKWTCRCCNNFVETIPFLVACYRLFPDIIKYPYGECPVCLSLTLLENADTSSFYRQLPKSPATGHEICAEKAVIFDYSLEYFDNPVKELERNHGHLLPGEEIIVRLSIVGGRAWRRYRDNLLSLDAPLNRYIPTPDGMEHIARRAGFRIKTWHGNTPSFVYTGSEMIRRIISPLQERPNYAPYSQMTRWAGRMARSEHGAGAAQATFILLPLKNR